MRKFTPLVFVILAMCLNACTRDRIDIDPDKAPGTDLPGDARYLGISLGLAGGVGTKADYDFEDGDNGFVYGTESEYAVRNLMILFFNAQGDQIYHVTASEQTTEEGENDIEKKFERLITIPLGGNDAEIEKTKAALASVTSFITILNYDPAWDKNGSDLYKATLKKSAVTDIDKFLSDYIFTINGSNGFVMSTAGHYDTAGRYIYYDTCEAGTIFYDTSSAALNNPVTVTVERLAARVDFEFIDRIDPVEVLYGTDVYELYFKPDRWGMEAEEKNGFISKKQQDKSYYGTTNNYPDGYAAWADYMSHRTFWAESPVFTGGTYAWRGDEYKDGKTSDAAKALSLRYTTFKELPSLLKNQDGYGYAPASCYIAEHTFNVSELNKAETKNPYAVPTSIVVGGQYEVTYLTTDEKPEIPSQRKGNPLDLHGEGFYLRFVDMERTDGVSDPAKKYQYRLYREVNDNGADDLYEALLKEQFVIFYRGEDGGYYPVSASTFFDGRSVASELFEITNTYANQYTLQLKTDIDFTSPLTEDLYYGLYVDEPAGAVYTKLASGNIPTANNLLKIQLGYAQRYWKGHAFFYAPIPHYTGVGSPFADGYSGQFNYKKNASGAYEFDDAGRYKIDHKNGEFGVVRNHIYKITVDHISTLGQGIPSEDAIPLPEPRIEHDIWQFDLSLKVLPWNQFQYTFDI